MKIIIGLLGLFVSFSSYALDVDFSEVISPRKELEADKLRYKIEVQADLLVFNKSGTRLLFKFDEERKWRFGSEKPITSYWNVIHKGMPTTAFFHEWQFNPQGELQMKFKQFESMSKDRDGGVKAGKLLQEKDFTIENMSAPTLVLFQDDNRRIVVQFRLQVWNDESAQDIGKLAINSTRMTIFDNKGNLWASRLDNSSGKNVYYGVKTHMGSLYISYVPFQGAKKIGLAEKNRIRLEQENLKVFIESTDFLLPKGVQANVYGYIDTNKRSERFNQVISHGSDREANFLEGIKR